MGPNWYILNYHNVSNEENIFLRGTGATLPTDYFEEHLKILSDEGTLVSIEEGFNLYKTGTINQPIFSIWFDDGYVGVRKNAKPLLDQYGINAAISINSVFAMKSDLFWRCKLSVIYQVGELESLKNLLQIHKNKNVKNYTLDNFSLTIIDAIDYIYNNVVSEEYNNDLLNVFDSFKGLDELKTQGWVIANHTSHHYPVGEDSFINNFIDQFKKCEIAIKNHLAINTKYWVIPFERQDKRSQKLFNTFKYYNDKYNRYLVLVGSRYNNDFINQDNVLYRTYIPNINGQNFRRFINNFGKY